MKRITIIILALLCCISAVVILWWFSDPAVHWTEVEDKLKGHFEQSDHDQSHDRTWIPVKVRNNPRRYYFDWKRSRMSFVTGFPNGDMGYHSYDKDYHIVLSVHLYENFARGISISYDSAGKKRANEIKGMFLEWFPNLPTKIIESVPNPRFNLTGLSLGFHCKLGYAAG